MSESMKMSSWIKIATTLTSLLVICACGCRDITIRSGSADFATFKGNLVEARYLSAGAHQYISLVAIQGGFDGWKERYLARDGLIGVQLVLRLPIITKKTAVYAITAECDGYVFLGTALGPVLAWRVTSGSVTAKPSTKGLEITGELQIERTYPEPSGTVPVSMATDSLSLGKVPLIFDKELASKILAPTNIKIQPDLVSWQNELNSMPGDLPLKN